MWINVVSPVLVKFGYTDLSYYSLYSQIIFLLPLYLVVLFWELRTLFLDYHIWITRVKNINHPLPSFNSPLSS